MAEIISQYTGQDVKPLEGLNEICLGDWDGKFIKDIEENNKDEYIRRGRDMVRYRPPGGENFLDLQERVTGAFRSILVHNGNIIIVAHASVNRIILRDVLKFPIESIFRVRQDYGCCNLLIQDTLGISAKLINGTLECIKQKLPLI